MTQDTPMTDPQQSESDDLFDLGYAPPTYAPPIPGTSGAWRTVISEGNEIGVVYTDYDQSAGVVALQQPPEIDKLRSFFQNMKFGSIPASSAYIGATALPNIEFGEEQSGPIEGIDLEMRRLMALVDEQSPTTS